MREGIPNEVLMFRSFLLGRVKKLRLKYQSLAKNLNANVILLECEVLGTPPFEVFWVKDDKPVRSSKKHRISTEKSLISLHVFRFDASDVGEYQCRVTNDVGSCLCSSEVTLKG